jgi:bifunctional N-acetylglucosamine-1-phosphate-uridyltransferase/glucosamine-1-phosphate-acetyltransferase GlmU-like protein
VLFGRKVILLGAKVREGCSIGPMCRVGGEVEESIIHGYSNKYHDGFLGHAYVGEWVNLGALTSNSDLKTTTPRSA